MKLYVSMLKPVWSDACRTLNCSMHPMETCARWLGVAAWSRLELHGLSEAEAVAWFEEVCGDVMLDWPDATMPSHTKRHCQKWYSRWQQSRDVQDAPRPGAPASVDAEEAAAMSVIFIAGTEVWSVDAAGQPVCLGRRPFTCMAGAVAHSSDLSECCQVHEIIGATLLARMEAANPNLVCRSLDFKMAFSVEQKRQRRQDAAALYSTFEHQLGRMQEIVWMDCGAFVLDYKMPSVTAWVDSAVAAQQATRPQGVSDHSWHPITVVWFMAVSGEHGPLYIELVTGTTGLQRAADFPVPEKREHHYLVSTMAPCWAACDTCLAVVRPAWAASACRYAESCSTQCVTRMLLNAGLNTSSGAPRHAICNNCMTHCMSPQQAMGR